MSTVKKVESKREKINQRSLGIRRALLNSICWGWLLSSVVTGVDWYAHGFEQANQRLTGIRHQSWQMASYRDTRWVQFIASTCHHIKRITKQLIPMTMVKNSAEMVRAIFTQEWLLPLVEQIKTITASGIKNTAHGVQLLKNNTLMIVDKLILFVLALPMLLVSSVLGIVDGLARREIREAEWGRESSFLFHRVMAAIPWLFFFVMTAYFVLPFWVPPPLFFIFVSMMTFGLLSQVVSQFKKQL